MGGNELRNKRSFVFISVAAVLLIIVLLLIFIPHKPPTPVASVPAEQLPPGPVTAFERARHLEGELDATVNRPESAEALATAPEDASVQQDVKSTDSVEAFRKEILDGPYGTVPIRQLVEAVSVVQGTELKLVYVALALRKQEALPLVGEKLRTGTPYEKRMMTKVGRYLGWAELVPQLLVVVGSESDHTLARTGAIYALAAIGDKSASPTLMSVLDDPRRDAVEKRVAIAALGRLGAEDAVPNIRGFLTSGDLITQIFAVYALAKLGANPDLASVLEACRHDDWLIRQEAANVLGTAGGPEVIPTLKALAESDPDSAVRTRARIALYEISIRDQEMFERIGTLKGLLSEDNTELMGWAQGILATQCGEGGRAAIRDAIEEKVMPSSNGALCLLMLEGAAPSFGGVQ